MNQNLCMSANPAKQQIDQAAWSKNDKLVKFNPTLDCIFYTKAAIDNR